VERRFVIFLALAFLVLMLNSMLVAPKRANRELAKSDSAAGENVVEPVTKPDQAQVDATEPSTVAQKAPEVGGVRPPQPAVDLKYVTLGSIAEDSSYRMLVTLTNHGAGVRRIEFASPRYRDLHDRGGYLGHLECVAGEEEGLLVQVVGAGTPAEQAGLQAGMRILKAGPTGEQPVASPEDLRKLIVKTKRGKPFALQVVDADGEQATLAVSLLRHPLDVIRPESENVLLWTDKLPKDFVEPPSFLLTLEQLGQARIAEDAEELAGIALRETHWEISAQDETSVTFRKGLPKQGIEILKHYRLEKVPAEKLDDQDYPGYGLTLDV